MTTSRAATEPPALLPPVLLVASGLLLQLPGIGRPFGIHEVNAGSYFGVFARNFERIGIAALNGVPIGPTLRTSFDANAVPYLSHPPGLFWLGALIGSDEAHLRLVTVAGHLAAVLLVYGMLVPLFGRWRAALGGLATLLFPSLAFYSQVSYETMVLPLGLGMMLAGARAAATTGRRQWRWRAVTAALALVGPWTDWLFLFFCLGLAVLVAGRPRDMLARLWLPALCAGASVAGVLLWGARLLGGPLVARPPLGTFLVEYGQRAIECFTAPALLIALVGLPFAAARAPRLVAALAVVGFLDAVVIPDHTMKHTLFLAYLSPLVATSIAGAARGPAAVRGLVAAVVLVSAGWSTLQLQRLAATTFYRDLGRVLTDATRQGDREYAVLYNLPAYYGYYVDSVMVAQQPETDPAKLEGYRGAYSERAGLRYLWVRWGEADGEPPLLPTDAALARYLARFPAEPRPVLEQRMVMPARDPVLALVCSAFAARPIRIAEAELVTLDP